MDKEKKTRRIRPQLLKGFRDYPPSEQIAREKILGKAREAVELMGFLPLQTASLESAEILLGSQYSSENLAELFGFEGPDEVEMALRYEFTVSLARYVASQPNLPFPFRRYQYGNVWRVDKPGPGRYREFMQFDIDIVGTNNLLADAEIMAAMVTIFEALGIDNFMVRYSNRKILNGLIKKAGINEERGPDVMRVLDKYDRIGKDKILNELSNGYRDDSGAKIEGLRLPESTIKNMNKLIDGVFTNNDDALVNANSILGDVPIAVEGISELEVVQSHLDNMGIDKSKTKVDLTIVRGLGYYTGPVFETTLLDLPQFGSVFSGGRYDNLMERFSSQATPAVGASIGIDRLLAALIELKAIKSTAATSKVLVTVMDKERLPEYLQIVREIREASIPCEIFSGDSGNLTKQVKYGNRAGIPLVIIAGSDEFDTGELTIKNLEAGAMQASEKSDRGEWLKAEGFQKKIARSELIAYLRKQLEID